MSNATAPDSGNTANQKTASTDASKEDPKPGPNPAKATESPPDPKATPSQPQAPAITDHSSNEIIIPHKNVVQIVTYSSRMVDNVSDIVEALNISTSASIKYGTIKGSGSASIVNENKVNQSDLNYIVTVKVTNETSPVADKMTFNPIPELDGSKFTEVFGK